MFRLPLGVAKGRRGRLRAACKHPGHLGKPRWLVFYEHAKPRMKHSNSHFRAISQDDRAALVFMSHSHRLTTDIAAMRDAN